MTELEKLYAAAEAAIVAFTDDTTDEDTVELVMDLMHQSNKESEAGNYAYAESLLEKASTFVQCDLDLERLDEWVEVCVAAMDEFGLFE